MKEEVLNDLKEQQINNYINIVKELISNNTKALFDLDINSLIVKPPLDSMDTIKNKYLEIGKKYKVTVDTEKMEKIIDKFRKALLLEIESLRDIRLKPLIEEVDTEIKNNDLNNIKVSKDNFNEINKKLNSNLKKIVKNNIEKYLINDIASFYIKTDDKEILEKINKDIEKYFTKNYLKQLIDNINLKIIVKDTILINVVKEQQERYLWTQNNSRINEFQ